MPVRESDDVHMSSTSARRRRNQQQHPRQQNQQNSEWRRCRRTEGGAAQHQHQHGGRTSSTNDASSAANSTTMIISAPPQSSTNRRVPPPPYDGPHIRMHPNAQPGNTSDHSISVDRRLASIIGGANEGRAHNYHRHHTTQVATLDTPTSASQGGSNGAAVFGNPFAIFTEPSPMGVGEGHPQSIGGNRAGNVRRFHCNRCGSEHDVGGMHLAACPVCGNSNLVVMAVASGTPAPPPPPLFSPHLSTTRFSWRVPDRDTPAPEVTRNPINPYLSATAANRTVNVVRERYFCHQCRTAYSRLPAAGPSCNVCHSECIELIEGASHLRELTNGPRQHHHHAHAHHNQEIVPNPRTTSGAHPTTFLNPTLLAAQRPPAPSRMALGGMAREEVMGGWRGPDVPRTPRRPRLEVMMGSIMGDHRIPMEVRVVFADMLRRQELNAPTPRSVLNALPTHTSITPSMRAANPLLCNACGVCHDELDEATSCSSSSAAGSEHNDNNATPMAFAVNRLHHHGSINDDDHSTIARTPANQSPGHNGASRNSTGDDEMPLLRMPAAARCQGSDVTVAEGSTIVLQAPIIVLPCNHSFHQDCILPWLKRARTCPNCRKNVAEGATGDDEDEEESDDSPLGAHDDFFVNWAFPAHNVPRPSISVRNAGQQIRFGGLAAAGGGFGGPAREAQPNLIGRAAAYDPMDMRIAPNRHRSNNGVPHGARARHHNDTPRPAMEAPRGLGDARALAARGRNGHATFWEDDDFDDDIMWF